MVPPLLNPHPYLDWPGAGSDAIQVEVQQVGANGRSVKVYVQVFVEVYAHAIWIFVVFWSDLVAQPAATVQSMKRDSQLWDPHLVL